MDFATILKEGKLKSKKKSGGFQSMGLSSKVLKGILKKGYSVPTPIQRKAIPVIMDNRNVVAMARTGSGKTAAFLIPMFEKLKGKVFDDRVRALIFSPTRELAMQTMKFTRELSKETNLKSALVLGGEKIETQFEAIIGKPDIIVATPGRFLHILTEMGLSLYRVEYVVFDEADRLFEMGFQEQLQEVLNNLNRSCQTVLFSATLPKVLSEFVKCRVDDPVVIRLDVEDQISENLKSAFLYCRTEDKVAVLLHILKNVIDVTQEMTIVFAATKYHIEYLKELLLKADIPCVCVYSSLDQAARKINIAKFRARQCHVLLVTDIAARGIDIPLLDNAINFHFPASSKLYVHRVGRVARAGRSGRAFSFVTADEAPYLLDLHLFLGKTLQFAKTKTSKKEEVCGNVPQSLIDEEAEIMHSWNKASVDLSMLYKGMENAYKQYIKSRPLPSIESIKRFKELSFASAAAHPIFSNVVVVEREKILSDMKQYRPNTTIFEFGALSKTAAGAVMRQKRQFHSMVAMNRSNKVLPLISDSEDKHENGGESSTSTSGNYTVKVTGAGAVKEKSTSNSKFKDNKHYLPYVSTDHYREKGLSTPYNFEKDAKSCVLDVIGDDSNNMNQLQNAYHWDRKRKKFIREGNDKLIQRKVKTESGAWVPRSYKTGCYQTWLKYYKKLSFKAIEKTAVPTVDREKQFETQPKITAIRSKRQLQRKKRQDIEVGKLKVKERPKKREIKTPEEILKDRKRKFALDIRERKRRQNMGKNNPKAMKHKKNIKFWGKGK